VNPLLFVNWRKVHRLFCTLMWLVVIVLAFVIVAHGASAVPVHHAARQLR
jgi:hypothetical protein